MKVIFCFALLFSAFSYSQSDSVVSSKEIVQIYCGACHVAPEPSNLTKDLWERTILPEMGSFYGIQKEGFGLLKKRKPAELEVIKSLNIYPETQVISDETWQIIQDHYINNAPESVSQSKERKNRSKNLKSFKRQDIDLMGLPESLITSMVFDDSKNRLWVGEDRMMAYSWTFKNGTSEKITTSSAVSDIEIKNDLIYLLEMGSLLPSELKKGSVSLISNNKKETLIDQLGRPVYMNVNDLNEDGVNEIVVCNFGNKSGGLEIYQQVDETFERIMIHQQAGAIKSVVHDMDKDGRKDLVVMFSQGDESIYIFYQKEDLKFEMEKVLRFNPLFGSNDFVLVDYEGDGDMDIVVAQGDNADISVIQKPYHGIRIFINTNNKFEEEFFYPLFGVTKVIAHDFDQDGDIDLAATAFFQEYEIAPNEGFVYLENLESDNYKFQSYTLKTSDPVKAYTLEKGDVDNDGDMDIIFGLFSWPITKVPASLKTLWQAAPYDMTVLFNKLE